MYSEIFQSILVPIQNRFKSGIIGVSAIFLGLVYGCVGFSAVPVTLKEVKDYVVGQEQSFSHSLDRVLAATVYNLRQTDFVILRIEHFNQKGLIHANWQDTSVKLSMETITPKLTKVSSMVRRGDSLREYSLEEEIFNNIRTILQREKLPNLGKLTREMVKVHLSPDKNSPVIAYMGLGARADLIKEEGDWGKIVLMDSGIGYIALKHLK